MAPSNIVVFALVLFAAISLGNTESSKYAFARVESCRGCSLNRLPEVKKFVFEDLPLYENIEFKPIPGAIPELILLNENEEEVERLQLSQLNREECNELLSSKGFTKSSKTIKDEI
ncbi:selenoprotein M [Cephus cinctus]|uniref:Selenoprotein M n=1 Tax=Cephus cinctus TaxID=211228 RepID=A0AAJ7FNI2_CEPCN|nr:selenoprotein M [Cephus cinctus]XP_015600573.1 selenoprotein M [Cephus cinctus]